MPPEPAQPLSAEAPSQSFWQLHCAKGKSPRAAINCPNAPQLRKATQAVFAPALRSPEGKVGRGCPWLPGPGCFAGGLRCPKPTPDGFSFGGSRIVRAKAFWAQAAAMPPEPPRPLSAKAPSHRRPKTSFWQLHCTKGKSPGAANNSPNAPRSGKQRKPFSPPGLRSTRAQRGGAAPGSLDPTACWGSPVPETHSRRVLLGGEAGLGARRPSAPRPQPAMPPEPARPLSAEAPSHRRPKTSFWRLHCAKGKSSHAANNSPNSPRLRKATQAVFAPGPPLSKGTAGRVCPWLPGPYCLLGVSGARNPLPTGLPLAPWTLLLAGGLRCPKPTPDGFSLAGKQDWAREGLLRPGRSHAP